MLERLGILEEIQATRARHPRHVARHDRPPAPVYRKPLVATPRKRWSLAMSDTTRRKVLAIMTAFCEVYTEIGGAPYTIETLQAPKRTRLAAWARHICMKLVRDITGLSTTQIGKAFRRDHTTVMYAILHADELMAKEPTLRATHDRVVALFAQVPQ